MATFTGRRPSGSVRPEILTLRAALFPPFELMTTSVGEATTVIGNGSVSAIGFGGPVCAACDPARSNVPAESKAATMAAPVQTVIRLEDIESLQAGVSPWLGNAWEFGSYGGDACILGWTGIQRSQARISSLSIVSINARFAVRRVAPPISRPRPSHRARLVNPRAGRLRPLEASERRVPAPGEREQLRERHS